MKKPHQDLACEAATLLLATIHASTALPHPDRPLLSALPSPGRPTEEKPVARGCKNRLGSVAPASPLANLPTTWVNQEWDS